jgi:hypothetical protein
MMVPGANIVQAIYSAWQTLQFIREKAEEVAALISAILDSIQVIIKGAVGAAANKIEKTLADNLPLVFDFLARLLGLGDVSAKMAAILEKLRTPVNTVVDKFMDVVISGAEKGKAGFKKMGGKAKAGISKAGTKVKEKVSTWWNKRKKFTTNDGETHELSFKGQKQPVPTVASTPVPVKTRLAEWKPQLKDKDKSVQGAWDNANNINTQLESMAREETAASKQKQGQKEDKGGQVEKQMTELSRVMAILFDAFDVEEDITGAKNEFIEQIEGGKTVKEINLILDKLKIGYALGEAQLEVTDKKTGKAEVYLGTNKAETVELCSTLAETNIQQKKKPGGPPARGFLNKTTPENDSYSKHITPIIQRLAGHTGPSPHPSSRTMVTNGIAINTKKQQPLNPSGQPPLISSPEPDGGVKHMDAPQSEGRMAPKFTSARPSPKVIQHANTLPFNYKRRETHRKSKVATRRYGTAHGLGGGGFHSLRGQAHEEVTQQSEYYKEIRTQTHAHNVTKESPKAVNITNNLTQPTNLKLPTNTTRQQPGTQHTKTTTIQGLFWEQTPDGNYKWHKGPRFVRWWTWFPTTERKGGWGVFYRRNVKDRYEAKFPSKIPRGTDEAQEAIGDQTIPEAKPNHKPRTTKKKPKHPVRKNTPHNKQEADKNKTGSSNTKAPPPTPQVDELHTDRRVARPHEGKPDITHAQHETEDTGGGWTEVYADRDRREAQKGRRAATAAAWEEYHIERAPAAYKVAFEHIKTRAKHLPAQGTICVLLDREFQVLAEGETQNIRDTRGKGEGFTFKNDEFNDLLKYSPAKCAKGEHRHPTGYPPPSCAEKMAITLVRRSGDRRPICYSLAFDLRLKKPKSACGYAADTGCYKMLKEQKVIDLSNYG